MDNQTNWTPGADDNKLGLSDREAINMLEAEGLIEAELFVYDLDESVVISASLILEIHRIAFGKLYDWAGKWRNVDVRVGTLSPPPSHQVPNQMYQFIDNLNFKIQHANNRTEQIACIFYAHYQFVVIHHLITEMVELDEC
jgi:cell filamentation protein